MGLAELLKELKSVEVIDDPDKIFERMDAAVKRSIVSTANGPHTTVVRTKDGQPVIRKASALASVETKAVPGIPTGDAFLALCESRGLKKDLCDPERMKSYWASDERVDSHGDIVRQNWFFDQYTKNPVLAYCHDWFSPPIGNGIDWAVTTRTGTDYSGPALWLLTLFAADEVSEWGGSIFRLVDAGILKSGSVGFFSAKLIVVNDEAERQRLGLGKWGYILDDNHLLEFSPCPIGANSGAHLVGRSATMTTLARAKRAGLILPGDVNTLREIERRSVAEKKGDVRAWLRGDHEIVSIARTLFAGHEFKSAKEIDAPIVEIEKATSVRGSVTAAAKSSDEELKDFMALTTDFLGGMAVTLEDLRGLMEEVREHLNSEATEISGEDDDGDESPAGSKSRSVANARRDSLRAKLDKALNRA